MHWTSARADAQRAVPRSSPRSLGEPVRRCVRWSPRRGGAMSIYGDGEGGEGLTEAPAPAAAAMGGGGGVSS